MSEPLSHVVVEVRAPVQGRPEVPGTLILAIDAAWTTTEPSGVALVASHAEEWRCIAVAPSYDSFVDLAAGKSVAWTQPRFSGSAPDVRRLLDGAQRLANAPVDLVTVDMPIATVPIEGRRDADNKVSREFGGRGCSTHTPNPRRPGKLGADLSKAFADEGFPIATSTTKVGLTHRLLEVYPHPALLTLLHCRYRVPYKIGKVGRYWPSSSRDERLTRLLCVLKAIDDALHALFGPFGVPLPPASSIRTLCSLKRYEDALDALVCAWVGVRYMQGAAVALGDEKVAIWCPQHDTPSESDRGETRDTELV